MVPTAWQDEALARDGVSRDCVQDLMFLSREGRDLRVAFQDPPGCQASSREEAKDSAVLPHWPEVTQLLSSF